METPQEELKHFGIMGMRWGKRKAEDTSGPSKQTLKLAQNDAKRHVEAKMFYGDSAGTKRKLLKAEIDKKKKAIPGYEDAFNSSIDKVDTKKAADKAVRDRVTIDTVDNGRRLIKKVLGVTGGLGIAAVTAVYYANKPKVDAFVMAQLQRLMP